MIMEEIKPITRKEFKRMVTMHGKWLSGNCGRRANFFGDRFEQGVSMYGLDLRKSDFRNSVLSGIDLSCADLSHANLSCANLGHIRFDGADLTGADLSNTSIVWSNLAIAKLSRADLKGANLNRSTMHGANLRNADLSHANLSYADFTNADLRNADLSHADLGYANLLRADLRGANLEGADLTCANMYRCRLDETETERMGTILESPIIGYKKSKEGRIVTLEIPEGAVVFSINNGKCRTNIAKVVDTGGEVELRSSYDPKFKYRVGEELRVKDFCMAYNVECESGIHFYKTRGEAVRHKI